MWVLGFLSDRAMTSELFVSATLSSNLHGATSEGSRKHRPPGAMPRVSRQEFGIALVLTVVALAPVIATVLTRWNHPYLPTQDQAIFDLRIRDALSFGANTPLVGTYSRFGWDHPGPIAYFLLAPFSAFFGQAAWASLVGAAILQGVAIVWTAGLAFVRGGVRWLVPWLTVMTLSYVGTEAQVGPKAPIYLLVWNPHIAFPFFVLFLLYVYIVALGETKHLFGLTFVATFLVQTHVGYALPVLVLVLYALVRAHFYVRARGSSLIKFRQWRVPLLAAVILWAPPLLLDPLLHPPGNVVTLFRFFLNGSGHQKTIGFNKALGLMAEEFHWRPSWLGGTDPVNPLDPAAMPQSLGWLLVPFAAIGSAWYTCLRKRIFASCVLAEMLALAAIVGIVAIAFTDGEPLPYVFYWRIVIGAACIVLPLWTLATVLNPVRFLNGMSMGVLLVALGLGTSNLASAVVLAPRDIAPYEPVAASILHQLKASDQPRGATLIRFEGTTLGGLEGAIFDQLAREGKHVFVDKEFRLSIWVWEVRREPRKDGLAHHRGECPLQHSHSLP